MPFLERKQHLAAMLQNQPAVQAIGYSEYEVGGGPEFYQRACKLKLEGVISKRIDAAYRLGDRGLWVKSKCLKREEFVVVGWTDPEGSRHTLGHSCWRTTSLTVGWFTRAESGPA